MANQGGVRRLRPSHVEQSFQAARRTVEKEGFDSLDHITLLHATGGKPKFTVGGQETPEYSLAKAFGLRFLCRVLIQPYLLLVSAVRN